MDPSPPHTPAKRRAALEERDPRRKLLEAAWSRIEPELDRAGHAGSYRTVRRDRRIVLIFDRRMPIDVRPLLETHGVSHLFTLEVDRDADDLQELGVSLRGVLDRGRFRSHGYGLNEDATGPLVFLTREPDSGGARRADAIC